MAARRASVWPPAMFGSIARRPSARNDGSRRRHNVDTRANRSGSDRRRAALPGPASGRRKSARRRRAADSRITTWLSVLARIVVPIVLLAVIAVGILYVRLLNGPISLKMLAQPIARAISVELPGVSVSVEDAVLAITAGSLFEVQLINVRFADAEGAPVAIAPNATVVLSDRAIWQGRIAPARVVLVEPRMLLTHTRDGRLSVSFGRGLEDRLPTDTEQRAPVPAAAPADAATPGRALDLGRAIAALTQDVRASGHSASHLKHLGMRNATLIVDNAGRTTVSRITDAELYLDHRRQGSGITASITFAMPEGTWRADIAAESTTQTGLLSVRMNVRDLVPGWIAGMGPTLAPLAAFRMPVGMTAEIALAPDGTLNEIKANIAMAPGAFRPPWHGAADIALDSGTVELAYTRQSGTLEMKPSEFRSGASWVRLAGHARTPGEGQVGGLAFAVRSLDGALAAEEFRIAPAPLEALSVQGRYLPETKVLELSEARLSAGGGAIGFAGRVNFAEDVPAVALEGRLGTMPAQALKRLWPAAFAADARRWTGNNVVGGRLVSAHIRIEEGGGTPARPLPSRSMASIEAADVRFHAVDGVPPVDAPRMLLRLEGPKLEVSMPEAGLTTAANRRLQFRQGRLTSPDVTSPLAMGDLTFRLQAPLPAALEVIDQHARANGKPPLPAFDTVDGRAEAQMRIGVPLGSGLAKWDVRVEGKGRVTEGRAKDVIGSHDVQGATINFDVSDQLIDAKGDMLVAGVPAKLAWQRIFGAAPGEQPALRISARLDAADRTQLGIDVNDLVQGETPVELTVQPRPGAEPSQVQVRADLTNADLQIEALAWRKPPGRAAFLEFEVRQGRGRTDLANFKVVGDDIAVDGTLTLDQHNKAREFNFPSFSLHVVSRLAVQGTLRSDNVWDVRVTGTTFVGREFFRSLFSVGQIGDKPLPPRKDRPGLDLKAEIETVLGFSDLALKNLRLQMSRRQSRIVALIAHGSVDGPKGTRPTPLEIGVQQTSGAPRKLVAIADDAGQVFRLVDFYPNMQGGRMRLEVNLDGSGPAERTGVLRVDQFGILGDPIVYEVLAPGEAADGRAQRRIQRPVLPFDRMTAPFSVGHGQFVLHDADLRGQAIGVLLKGKADFRSQTVDLGGTYIPLQGLNSVLSHFPVLGQLLTGARGEGVVGMTYAIKGPMSRPEVLVNPLSGLLPGILRDMMQMTNPSPRITVPDAPKRAPEVRGSSGKASSAPPATVKRDGGPPAAKVDSDGGWSQGVEAAPPSRKK